MKNKKAREQWIKTVSDACPNLIGVRQNSFTVCKKDFN